MATKEKTSDKGKLVKKWAIHQPKDSYPIAPGRNEKGSGIYILYNGDEVYYVGLSTISIKARLGKHAKRDHHKENWDNFSFYQIPRKKYVKDIESILLGTYKTEGNKVAGRLKKANKVVVNLD
jgi:hypothetical protein